MSNLKEVLDLLVNAAEWLQSKETTQWDYYLNDLEGNTDEVSDSIRNGSTYLLLHEDRPIASVTLEDQPSEWDMDLWEGEAHEHVMYLHRLVLHRDYSGIGLGNKLLDWSENHVKASGRYKIRFDCLASNQGLNSYYQRRYTLKEIANKYGQHCKYEVDL